MFQDWLIREETHRNNIVKLDIFDFDDTLVHTPNPIQAKDILHKHNIQAALNNCPNVKHVDGPCFWYSYQSLRPPIVPDPCPCHLLNQQMARNFNVSARDPRRFTVILTGRPPHLEKDVRRILNNFQMEPNRLLMVPASARTMLRKMDMMTDLLGEFPNIEEVEVWDDKGPMKSQISGNPDDNHVSEFKKFLTLFNNYKGGKMKCNVHEVPPRDEQAVEFIRKYAQMVDQQRQEKKEKEAKKKKKAAKKKKK